MRHKVKFLSDKRLTKHTSEFSYCHISGDRRDDGIIRNKYCVCRESRPVFLKVIYVQMFYVLL